MVLREAASGLERIMYRVLVEEFKESIDMCTGCHGLTKIMFKTAISTIQSVSQPSRKYLEFYAPASVDQGYIVFGLSVCPVYLSAKSFT